ncbi:EIN3-binding F-box protein 1-like [Panicum miliaceum]|uniref:EIN3-binding F-box protein 1-like n=1 Tax=Panicum miliaceum TaxID=4540 RepID=A0A3L6PV88_PANMI|nr:EIN3-binding F-box protein 1-like [Panicum miliaceum]
MSPFQGYRGDVAPKRQKRREEPSPDALPDECLFEVLRRVRGARVHYAFACVSRCWLALLAGIRASEAVLAPPAPAVPDLNMEYLDGEDNDDEADLMDHDGDARERTFEGNEVTDARLMAAAVAGRRLRLREPPKARHHKRGPVRPIFFIF